MFPIRDHNPSQNVPVVTYTLIGTNVVVFLSYAVLLGNPPALMAFYNDWALIPARSDAYSYLTSMFLHGGWMHLIGNMLFLWIFGDNLEDEMGPGGFLLFYLASGVGAGLAHVGSAPFSQVPTVGASGAIAGVMGGYLLLFPKARVDILVFLIIIIRILPVPAWVVLAAWFGLQVFNGAATASDGAGVAYWAHAGGFVIGLVLTIPVWLRRGGQKFWETTHGHPPNPEAQYTRTRIPTVKGRHRRRGPWG